MTKRKSAPCSRMSCLIPAVERALTSLSAGKIQQPVRTDPAHRRARIRRAAGLLRADAGYRRRTDGREAGHVLRAQHALPTHQAVIQLLSAETGEPLVAMDGRLITEMRTAAVSAVATRLFAAKDARTLAILGSGVQARSHLEALRGVRIFPQVRVWSRTPAHAQRFASEIAVRLPMATPESAVRGADVVVTVASVHEPLAARRMAGAARLGLRCRRCHSGSPRTGRRRDERRDRGGIP